MEKLENGTVCTKDPVENRTSWFCLVCREKLGQSKTAEGKLRPEDRKLKGTTELWGESLHH